MTKPAIDQVRFASTTDGNTTYQVEPTAGLKNTGYTTGNKPAAQHHTWLFRKIYGWLAYLDELLGGATGVSETLKAGGLTTTGAVATGSLAATGNATVGGTLGVTGLTTLASEAVTGNATVGGTLGVTGATTLTGGVNGALVATGAVTATDLHYSVARSRMIPATTGTPAVSTQWVSPAGVNVFDATAGPSLFTIPITVESGETITVSVSLLQDAANAGGSAALKRADHVGGVSPTIVGTATIATATGDQTLSLITSHAVVTDNEYWVEVLFGGGAANHTIRSVKVSYTR